MRVGLISDTHGLLRAEAVMALAGCDHIIHAGDIGKEEILESLNRIAPVTVVRGNIDVQEWASILPRDTTLDVERVKIYVIHDLHEPHPNPARAGVDVMVFGHSHKPEKSKLGDILYVNPGSAGRRRFRLPVTVARLEVTGRKVDASFIDLETGEIY